MTDTILRVRDLQVEFPLARGLVRDLLFGQTVDKVRHGLEIPMLIARPDRAGLNAPSEPPPPDGPPTAHPTP